MTFPITVIENQVQNIQTFVTGSLALRGEKSEKYILYIIYTVNLSCGKK